MKIVDLQVAESPWGPVFGGSHPRPAAWPDRRQSATPRPGGLVFLGRAGWADPPQQLHPPGLDTAATLAVAAGATTRELMVRMGHYSSAAE